MSLSFFFHVISHHEKNYRSVALPSYYYRFLCFIYLIELQFFWLLQTNLRKSLIELGEVDHAIEDVIGYLQQVETDLQKVNQVYGDSCYIEIHLKKIEVCCISLNSGYVIAIWEIWINFCSHVLLNFPYPYVLSPSHFYRPTLNHLLCSRCPNNLNLPNHISHILLYPSKTHIHLTIICSVLSKLQKFSAFMFKTHVNTLSEHKLFPCQYQR